jgi:hypothetical protein
MGDLAANTSYREVLIDNPAAIRTHVVIFFYGRSGSFLLGSLLDNHSEVICPPPRSLLSFFSILLNFLIERKSNLSEKILLDFVEREFPNLFKVDAKNPRLGADHYGDHGVVLEAYQDAFRRGLLALFRRGEVNFHNLCSLFQAAYAYALGQELSVPNPVAIWQAHSPMTSDEYKALHSVLPDVRFVTMVRRPEKTLDSHLHHTHKEACPKEPEWILLNRLVHHLMIDDAVPPELADRYRAVRFEDIHAATEPTMRALAEWLGIGWEPCLLESTIDGKEFTFGSHGKEKKGTDPNQAKDIKTKRLWALDRWKCRFLLERTYDAWGYSKGKAFSLLRNPTFRRWAFYLPSRFQIELMVEEIGEVLRKHWRAHRVTTEKALARYEDRSKGYQPIPLLRGSDTRDSKV